MKVERHQSYPVSASELLSVLTHREFFQWRFKASDDGSFRFDAFDETAEGLLIRVHRDLEVKSDKVPALARKFLGNSTTLVTEFLWRQQQSQPFLADYRFHVTGVPVAVSGQMRVLDEGGQAKQHLVVEVSSSIPLIGGKLVSMVGGYVEKGLDSDYRSTLKFIERQAGKA